MTNSITRANGFCPACGFAIDRKAGPQCLNCGRDLNRPEPVRIVEQEEFKFCPLCTKKIPADARGCYCGWSMKPQRPAPFLYQRLLNGLTLYWLLLSVVSVLLLLYVLIVGDVPDVFYVS